MQIVATVNAAAADFGRIDILINNVAISDNKHLFEITKEEWDRVFAVCLTAPMLFSKYAAKAMISAGHGGKIVNVSSTSGHYGRGRAIAYTAAKAGVKIGEVKRSYYEAVLARHSLEIASENRATLDELLRVNTERFQAGAIAEGELLKVRLERVRFDAAVRKALAEHFPGIVTIRLEDYKVRIINSTAGADAAVRVLIESATEDGLHRWRTVGASTDVVEA